MLVGSLEVTSVKSAEVELGVLARPIGQTAREPLTRAVVGVITRLDIIIRLARDVTVCTGRRGVGIIDIIRFNIIDAALVLIISIGGQDA